jgi:hypothetical protein
MGVLFVGGLLVVAAYAAVDPDISLSRDDQDAKQAYAAADAGLQWYLNRLNVDNAFYLKCSDVDPPSPGEVAPIYDREWDGVGDDPRAWRPLPGEKAEYAVELVPAPNAPIPFGETQRRCVENDQYSMIDDQGNLRLRVTGRSRGEYRTVVATLRRFNFIDYVYFTNFETKDPDTYANTAEVEQANNECQVFRSERTSFCDEIQFAPTDDQNGPVHTNDSIIVCGHPLFGRNSSDRIELNGDPPYGPACAGGSPNIQGTLVAPAGVLEMPPSNAELANIVGSDYHYYGRTTLVLNANGTMTVTGRQSLPTASVTTKTLPMPSKGVFYVSNLSCPSGYVLRQTYSTSSGNPSGCGDVIVRGTYATNLTVAADNDVLVNGNLVRGNQEMLLGLIANNFVRVYHPGDFSGSGLRGGPYPCRNSLSTPAVSQIDAAILALQHSFIVDNYYCGNPMGDLTVTGAIAQRYRGPVGTVNSGSIYTGYSKNYNYNDRLRYREPPYFLDPVHAAWHIARQTERVPAIAKR